MWERGNGEVMNRGALNVFPPKGGTASGGKEKYPARVKVYSVGSPSAGSGPPFSRELCGGPHVENTAEVGKFVIVKEEAVASGVRRIRAQVIP